MAGSELNHRGHPSTALRAGPGSLRCIRLNSTLRTGVGRFHVSETDPVSKLGVLSVIGKSNTIHESEMALFSERML